MDLRVSLAGLDLKNPILTASGTFGYGLEFAAFGRLEDLGGIVVKGLSLKPRTGNPQPRIVETACGMLNAIGLENMGVQSFVRDQLPLLPWRKTPILANIYGRDTYEFQEVARHLAGAQGVAGLEVNISCPNVASGGMQFGQDPVQAARLTKAVKDQAERLPVFVKLSPNVTDITVLARAVEEAGADGISLINTLTGMAVDLNTRRPSLANVQGGLSGPAIKPIALYMVHQVLKVVSIPVIGIGGITSAEDILEFILIGAHAVQVGTANFMRPDKVFGLARDLGSVANSLDIDSWPGFRGSLDLDGPA